MNISCFSAALKALKGTKYWIKVLAACPKQLKTEILLMPFIERSLFILNGFGSVFIAEWNDLYCALSMFILKMFDGN